MDLRDCRVFERETAGAGFLQALDSQYSADISKALATIDVYMASSVGIGEHPQHLEELDKLFDCIATALDKQNALRKYYRVESSP